MKYAIVQLSGKQFLIKVNQWYDIDFISKKFFGEYLFFAENIAF